MLAPYHEIGATIFCRKASKYCGEHFLRCSNSLFLFEYNPTAELLIMILFRLESVVAHVQSQFRSHGCCGMFLTGVIQKAMYVYVVSAAYYQSNVSALYMNLAPGS